MSDVLQGTDVLEGTKNAQLTGGGRARGLDRPCSMFAVSNSNLAQQGNSS